MVELSRAIRRSASFTPDEVEAALQNLRALPSRHAASQAVIEKFERMMASIVVEQRERKRAKAAKRCKHGILRVSCEFCGGGKR